MASSPAQLCCGRVGVFTVWKAPAGRCVRARRPARLVAHARSATSSCPGPLACQCSPGRRRLSRPSSALMARVGPAEQVPLAPRVGHADASARPPPSGPSALHAAAPAVAATLATGRVEPRPGRCRQGAPGARGDHVDHAAQRLGAVQHRQRAAHDLDALDVVDRIQSYWKSLWPMTPSLAPMRCRPPAPACGGCPCRAG
jgi:hypothetical protein